jgi:hypothetical protein
LTRELRLSQFSGFQKNKVSFREVLNISSVSDRFSRVKDMNHTKSEEKETEQNSLSRIQHRIELETAKIYISINTNSLTILEDMLDDMERGINLIPFAWADGLARCGCALALCPQNSVQLRLKKDYSKKPHARLGGDQFKKNLWSTRFQRTSGPLSIDCRCNTCSRHSCSYIHHLLQVHEITAEVLLQVHNRYHIHRYLLDVRTSLLQSNSAEYLTSLRQKLST